MELRLDAILGSLVTALVSSGSVVWFAKAYIQKIIADVAEIGKKTQKIDTTLARIETRLKYADEDHETVKHLAVKVASMEAEFSSFSKWQPSLNGRAPN